MLHYRGALGHSPNDGELELGVQNSLEPSLSIRMVSPGTQTLTIRGQVQDLELHNHPHCQVKKGGGRVSMIKELPLKRGM